MANPFVQIVEDLPASEREALKLNVYDRSTKNMALQIANRFSLPPRHSMGEFISHNNDNNKALIILPEEGDLQYFSPFLLGNPRTTTYEYLGSLRFGDCFSREDENKITRTDVWKRLDTNLHNFETATCTRTCPKCGGGKNKQYKCHVCNGSGYGVIHQTCHFCLGRPVKVSTNIGASILSLVRPTPQDCSHCGTTGTVFHEDKFISVSIRSLFKGGQCALIDIKYDFYVAPPLSSIVHAMIKKGDEVVVIQKAGMALLGTFMLVFPKHRAILALRRLYDYVIDPVPVGLMSIRNTIG